jgi:ribosome recycling factor
MMTKEILSEVKQRMSKTIDDQQKEMLGIRTGKASIHLLDHIVVDYYGTMSPVNQMASLSVPEPSMIVVQPWDISLIQTIEKAIRSSDLGVNPANDGKVIRIPIPPLTEERRKQLAKQIHNIAEHHRVAIRQVRHDGNDRLKKLLKDKEISEDEEREALRKIQELTDQHIKMIEELAEKKEEEILKI